jgi:predicted dehydrogenase
MTLRIGILGAAHVATYAMIGAARDVAGVEVAGVASRDIHRAKTYAAEHGIPHVYENYAALIASPDIDSIYNALPPSLHALWSIAALQAGRPVLCEKPFALTSADVRAMLAAAQDTGQILMEAQHTRYHPLMARCLEIMQSKILGPVQHAEAHFTITVPQTPTEIRYQPEVGGGALWDLGVYPAYWLRTVMGEEPVVTAARHTLANTGADIDTQADLLFPSGATGRLSCAMHGDLSAYFKITGSKGTLHMNNPLAPSRGHLLTLTVDGHATTETFTKRPTYCFQLEAFRDATTSATPVLTTGADSLQTLTFLESIHAAAKAGSFS